MADKIQMPAMPSPMDLAREAAELEKQEHLQQAEERVVEKEPVKQKPTQKTKEKSVDFDFSKLDASKRMRVTRTFTLDVETEAKLNQMSDRFNMSKSALLEYAFNAFYEAAQKK